MNGTLASGQARQLGQAERHDTLQARNTRLVTGETITVRVRRSDDGRLAEHRVPYRKWMRVLDALTWISENEATDLGYRWFCGSKMCGTCAVRMNGREVLACWEAVEPDMTIEPLRNLPVLRDLVVDRTPFDRKVEMLEPWVERNAPYAGFPEPLNHKQMKNASKALDCIGCMCCYSACPVIGLGDLTDFAGPAPSCSSARPRWTLATILQRWPVLSRSRAFSIASPATNARRFVRPPSRSSRRSSSR